MSYCVNSSLLNMKYAGVYGFYKNQNTDCPSLIFGSM